jgi:hypothetical protein
MAQPSLDRGLGANDATDGSILSRYLLDTTVLMRTCVATALLPTLFSNVSAKATHWARRASTSRRSSAGFGRRNARKPTCCSTDWRSSTREAATRAGRYQADRARRGRTIHTPDALIAGTARAHGAVLVTDNLDDFPMRDVRVESLAAD